MTKTIKNKIVYEESFNELSGKTLAVVFPDDVEEIVNLVRAGNKDIVVRVNGTSFTGANVPINSTIVDLSKMNKILEINTGKKTVNVEPGVLLNDLNEELFQYGLEFPIIPIFSGVETVGGIIAKNSSGAREIKYGRVSNWVDSIVIVNAKGEEQKIPKSDLSEIVGMEGTTGIIIMATLRLTTRKERSLTILKSEKLSDIVNSNKKLRFDQEVSSIDLINPTISSLLGFEPKYHLFVEYESSKGFFKGEEYNKYMKLKNKFYKKIASEGPYIIENVKVLTDSVMDFLIYLEENRIPYFGHLASGVFYFFFRPEQQAKIEACLKFAKKLRGRVSYSLGVGITKKEYLDLGEIDLIKRVKKRLDASGKFNKGKLIDYNPKEAEVRKSRLFKDVNEQEDDKVEDSSETNEEYVESIENDEKPEQIIPTLKREDKKLTPDEREKIKKIASGFFAGGVEAKSEENKE